MKKRLALAAAFAFSIIPFTSFADHLEPDENQIKKGGELVSTKLKGYDLFSRNLSDDILIALTVNGYDIEPGADLSRAELSNADLVRADLSGANLTVADLSRANLFGANLSDANLFGANLSDANLTVVDLSNADLSGAILGSADLGSADLSNADLSRALSLIHI